MRRDGATNPPGCSKHTNPPDLPPASPHGLVLSTRAQGGVGLGVGEFRFFSARKKTKKPTPNSPHPIHTPLTTMRHTWHPGSGAQHTSYSTHASARAARSMARDGLLFTDQLGGFGSVDPNPPFLPLFCRSKGARTRDGANQKNNRNFPVGKIREWRA